MDTAGIMDKKGQIRFNDDSNGILYELVNMGKPVAVHLVPEWIVPGCLLPIGSVAEVHLILQRYQHYSC